MPAIISKWPIFNDYDLGVLSRRLDKSASYLDQLARGSKPLTHGFKFNTCGLLQKSMEELFGPEEEEGDKA